MENVYEMKVIFGGLRKANKKDKTTGAKLAEEYAVAQVLQVDDNDFVQTKQFFISVEDYEKYLDLKLKVLEPCMVSLKMSATSNFSQLMNLYPLKVLKV